MRWQACQLTCCPTRESYCLGPWCLGRHTSHHNLLLVLVMSCHVVVVVVVVCVCVCVCVPVCVCVVARLRAHVLAFMCLVGAMRAMWRRYTAIVPSLFRSTRYVPCPARL